MGPTSLRNLIWKRNVTSHRQSSFDTTGGNADNFKIAAGATKVLADIEGSGCITHLWCTISSPDPWHLRKIVLRMFWEGQDDPAVECPVGDFYGLGHGAVTYLDSLPLQMFHRGLNCFFSMPFNESARVEVTNETDEPCTYYSYVDYELNEGYEKEILYFHSQWRRTYRRKPKTSNPERKNTTGKNNHVILDARGYGHYVGCVLNVDTPDIGWWGEGDDMFFVDGEKWPPSLHGTGTEDYFCGAWNYNSLERTFCTPYFGYHFKTNDDYSGKHSQYRFHIEDPITFKKSLLASIERGHDNDKVGDWTSTAYWYQCLEKKPFPKLPPAEARVPKDHRGLERPGRLPRHRDLY